MSYRPGMRARRMLAIPAHGMSLLCLLAASGCAQVLGIEDLPDVTDGGTGPQRRQRRR
jgi:hypothetical protein